MDLLKGRIQGNKDGYGFFIPEDGSGDHVPRAREMEKLFDGDEVLARHSGFDNRGRREGMVVEILKRRFEQIVGRYYREGISAFWFPIASESPMRFLIPDQQAGSAGRSVCCGGNYRIPQSSGARRLQESSKCWAIARLPVGNRRRGAQSRYSP